ncbi:LacI family DNA-binding transcriptional regulator [Coraliomargarita algicola]|uniref:LacI family DNA-binding transcriptional regulator n=1 Tax=Coraliomargarita algicola TaxID=3092156 RepID=A0ABZ0RHE5_9BACT|nr:LacI family DNA-binding transcriptional regulator [Coraliomargarita sp. J2-16]WPJ95576.1 LacI family DNA-binding transcriptional regulator [Coraliomargarita sp. J2-16]
MTTPRKVTQSDVARAAKVSQGVVSCVLSGRSSDTLSVGDETRRRVLAVANELGYRVRSSVRREDSAAASRKQVLLVTPAPHRGASSAVKDSAVSVSYRSFMEHSVTEIGAHLSEHGVGLSIHQLTSEKGLMQWLTESDVCAVIWHTSVGDGSLLGWVAARYPLVVVNQAGQSTQLLDGVSINQALNVRLPMDHLWESGHRKIAYFGQVPGNLVFEERLSAYRGFVCAKNIHNYEEFQAIPDEQLRPAAEKVQMILDTWESLGEGAPTAIVLGDVFALLLLGAAQARGIRIPEDLSVVGIDNVDACDYVSPRLTSVAQCFPALCESVVERLMRRIQNPDSPTQFVAIAPYLVERDSVRKFSQSEVEAIIDN